MKITHIFAGLIILLALCAIGYIAYKVQNPGAAIGGLGILGAILQGWKGIFSGGTSKKLEEQVARIEGKYDPRVAKLEAELAEKEREIDRLTQLKISLLQRNRDLEMDIIAQRAAQKRAAISDWHATESERLSAAQAKYEASGDLSGYREFLEARRASQQNPQ